MFQFFLRHLKGRAGGDLIPVFPTNGVVMGHIVLVSLQQHDQVKLANLVHSITMNQLWTLLNLPWFCLWGWGTAPFQSLSHKLPPGVREPGHTLYLGSYLGKMRSHSAFITFLFSGWVEKGESRIGVSWLLRRTSWNLHDDFPGVLWTWV